MSLIKKYLIQEAVLLDIDEDVDYIYDNWGFKEFVQGWENLIKDKKNGKELDTQFLIDLFGKNVIDYINNPLDKELLNFKNVSWHTSEELPSKIAKQAHRKKPVDIFVGIKDGSANYSPIEKEINIYLSKYIIHFTINSTHLQYKNLSSSIMRDLEQVFEEREIKNDIKHELSHWIRDSIHNKHLEKIFTKMHKKVPNMKNLDKEKYRKTVKKYVTQGHNDIYQTYFEMDATVHGISAHKKTMTEDEWNSLTLFDLFIKYTSDVRFSIERIYKNHGKKDLDYFLKTLVKRMHRAGLLGDNMKHYNINDFIKYIEEGRN